MVGVAIVVALFGFGAVFWRYSNRRQPGQTLVPRASDPDAPQPDFSGLK
jgi:hypothetical protein